MKTGQTVITNDEMQIIELNSEFLGVSHFQLMEAVGSQIAREIANRIPRSKPNPRIDVISGPGKNGGDGFSAARHLAALGYSVKVTLIGRTLDVVDYAAKHQLDRSEERRVGKECRL